MVSIGVKGCFIGLEATTDEELKGMNKECDAVYNRKAIEVLKNIK